MEADRFDKRRLLVPKLCALELFVLVVKNFNDPSLNLFERFVDTLDDNNPLHP